MPCITAMTKRQHLLSLARLMLPTVGLGLICVGVYVKTVQSEDSQGLRDVAAYLFIILGFTLLVIGLVWSVGHVIRSVLFKFSVRRHQNTDVSVFTVDRSNLYPPSYDESQVRSGVTEETGPVDTVTQCPGLAPPVYTESSSEIISEDFSHEEPPTYQQAVYQKQAAKDSVCLPHSSAESL